MGQVTNRVLILGVGVGMGMGMVVGITALAAPAHAEDTPIGWASVESGTRGGGASQTVTVSTTAALTARAESAPPLVIRVEGTIRLARPLRIKSNKTILGAGSDATIVGGGFLIANKVNNIIIRNLTFKEAPNAISIESGAHHVWIDHCDLSQCADKLLVIKRGADLITVSWNHFHGQDKTCLVGHSDDDETRLIDQGHLRVTYHHNFFDGTRIWNPRVRFAEPVHIFNNYFKDNPYGVAAVMNAGVLVEGNVFENVPHPTDTQFGDSPDRGRLVERRNLYIQSGTPQVRGTVAEPRQFYSYTPDDPANIANIVTQGAGTGKMGL